jgi:hypothetical protein
MVRNCASAPPGTRREHSDQQTSTPNREEPSCLADRGVPLGELPRHPQPMMTGTRPARVLRAPEDRRKAQSERQGVQQVAVLRL